MKGSNSCALILLALIAVGMLQIGAVFLAYNILRSFFPTLPILDFWGYVGISILVSFVEGILGAGRRS